MNARRTAFLLLAFPLAAAAQREVMAFASFDATPSAPHPPLAAELAWMDGGRISAFASARPEGEGVVSAPHFQLLYGKGRCERVATLPRDSVVDRYDRTRLRLGTGLALSQIGLLEGAPGGFDVALGASFERAQSVSRWTTLDGMRQWVDVSLAVRKGCWSVGATLVDAATISTDSGIDGARALGLKLQRTSREGLDWGGSLDVPLESGGEAALRLGVSRDFRDALSFQGELATSYGDEVDHETGDRELVRKSLEIRLGSRLKFRPWGASEGDSWMRKFVDPQGLRARSGGFLLRGWELGVSAGWDLVGGQAVPAVELAKRF